ncbi:MAG: TolC family protein [Gemmatimonadetes bacterium]|nr:TolC family protein [Gemmatimonadota bacterium]
MKLQTSLLLLCGLSALAWLTRPAISQQLPRGLTLQEARAAARRVSPDLAAARAGLDAAAARARQAGALANPALSYAYEQTSAGGQRTSQSIATLEQPLELTGVRGARQDAAMLRREATEADLRAVEELVRFEVTRAYALAQAADERMTLAVRAATDFDRAQRVTGERLVAGDVSGYEARRIRLESARYAALRAEAALARRTAYLSLATLVGAPTDSLLRSGLEPLESIPPPPAPLSLDSILTLALRQRPELLAAERQAAAALAEARAVGRERIPVPVASAGWKTERTTIGGARLDGFVAGVSFPLPFWDRRAGAVAAADADARRSAAELDIVRRRVVREAEEAYAALLATADEVERLSPAVGAEAAAALRAAGTAYLEGEIPLLGWLDAVRAYHEAESISVTLRADLHVRRAALERATGGTLFEDREP